MPDSEPEDARREELAKTVQELRPLVNEQRQRSAELAERSRRVGVDLVLQVASQALGTLVAAGVAYLVAVAVGALEGVDPLTILVIVILAGAVAYSLWILRLAVLPSHRRSSRLLNAQLELDGIDIRAKLRNGEALTTRDARLIQLGLIDLEDPSGDR